MDLKDGCLVKISYKRSELNVVDSGISPKKAEEDYF
jgi:hypothetical protein